MVNERPLVPIPVGPHSFSTRDIWKLSVVPCSGLQQQRDCLVGSCIVPSKFANIFFSRSKKRASVTKIVQNLGWRTLEQRRADALFYKVLHGIVAVPLPDYIQYSNRVSRTLAHWSKEGLTPGFKRFYME